jgi:hypothetical protein
VRAGVAPDVLIALFWRYPRRRRQLALSLPLNTGMRTAIFAGALCVLLWVNKGLVAGAATSATAAALDSKLIAGT